MPSPSPTAPKLYRAATPFLSLRDPAAALQGGRRNCSKSGLRSCPKPGLRHCSSEGVRTARFPPTAGSKGCSVRATAARPFTRR